MAGAGATKKGETARKDIWALVRENVIGRDASIETPFGRRLLTYADYTASGRGVEFIESHIRQILRHYANTHTEDDATGAITSARLHQAEATIKRLVNAGPGYKIIEEGSGTTGAVHRLQQILGLYVPPAAMDLFTKLLKQHLEGCQFDSLKSYLLSKRPVVFVGPYEHHSNEVSWRECFAEVVEIELDREGLLDLDDLEAKLSRPEYEGRRLIGAFSAASNVSGVTTPVYEVARRLHRHGALAFFDYAASAPYTEIDMRRDDEAYFDGIYFSPHKFLGGPGSSGILIIHEGVYRKDLPPTVGAGGTVDYVSFNEQAYSVDIEAREKPGTPGILQIIRAAMAMELKDLLGTRRIAARENELIHRALEKFNGCSRIEIMGNRDPDKRIPIFSFNIRVDDSYLHPRYATILLNDLFGIQSRAGCSCAGPYGHRVLHIDGQKSLKFKDRLMHGFGGLKPGWIRINFHYLMTDADYQFIMAAICFVCEYGRYFLPLYEFDIHTGGWRHRTYRAAEVTSGLEQALEDLPGAGSRGALGNARAGGEDPFREQADAKTRKALYDRYLTEAKILGEELKRSFESEKMKTTEKDLIPFVYV
ncbi:MAG: aminotransferase class V-fold PLP-dependent enzyme [Spirochaetales bacterium]|nr:aminotransferase class V-fold PLP-dependent enzyme [Spirochaetales bacterium]